MKQPIIHVYKQPDNLPKTSLRQRADQARRLITRRLRRLFEHRRIHQFFGVSVVSVALSVGVIPPSLTLNSSLGYNLGQPESSAAELKTERSVRLPLGEYRVSQGFHLFHAGIDLASPPGSDVHPIMDGVVETATFDRYHYGNHILVNHGSGLRSLYAHLSRINVIEGDLVDKNTVIGLVGSTGHSTGPHLHLEVSENDKLVNPSRFLEEYFGTKLAQLSVQTNSRNPQSSPEKN